MHSVIIFSVDRADRAAAENAAARALVERSLAKQGIAFKRANGSYQGTPEQSYIVADTPETLARVRQVAAWQQQDSILRVNERGQAWIETPDGSDSQLLGYLVSVAPHVAQESPAYTEADGNYYIAVGRVK